MGSNIALVDCFAKQTQRQKKQEEAESVDKTS